MSADRHRRRCGDPVRNYVFFLFQNAAIFGTLISSQIDYTPGASSARVLGRKVMVIGAHNAEAVGRIQGTTVSLLPWWLAALEHVAKTLGQALAADLTGAVFLTDVDWIVVLPAALGRSVHLATPAHPRHTAR